MQEVWGPAWVTLGRARLPKDLNIQPKAEGFSSHFVRDANSRAEPGLGRVIDGVLKI